MLPALIGAVVGALVAGLVAWALAARADRGAAFRDLWGAVDGLREEQADTNEHLAELRGLVAGLYRYHGERIDARTPLPPKRRIRK